MKAITQTTCHTESPSGIWIICADVKCQSGRTDLIAVFTFVHMCTERDAVRKEQGTRHVRKDTWSNSEWNKKWVLVLNTGWLRCGTTRKIELLNNCFLMLDSYKFRSTPLHLLFFPMNRIASNTWVHHHIPLSQESIWPHPPGYLWNQILKSFFSSPQLRPSLEQGEGQVT